jgi:hypothetical protein
VIARLLSSIAGLRRQLRAESTPVRRVAQVAAERRVERSMAVRVPRVRR